MCLAEACIANGLGARVVLPGDEDAPPHALMFGEEPSRIIVSIDPSHVERVAEVCASREVPFEKIGTVTGETLKIEDACEVPVKELAVRHASALDGIVT